MRKIISCILISFSLNNAALADPSTNSVAGSGSTASLPSSSATTLMTSSNTGMLSSTGTSSLVKSNAVVPVSLTQYCPTIDQLVKDPQKLTWSVPGGWQSYQQSFATKIAQFTGVQWAGIKIGQVICTYRGEGSDTFPIQLVYNKLVFQPSGSAWGQNMDGYINCKTNDVNDCPFPVQLTQHEDVYKEADQIQRSNPQEEEAF